MRTVVTRGLRAHRFRLFASALAIALGAGFVAGVLIFGDTAKASFFDEFARPAHGVDVVVADPGRPTAGPSTELADSTLGAVHSVAGVAAADGRMQQFLPLLDRSGKLVGDRERPGLAMSAGTVPSLRPYDVISGRTPAVAGEAALDMDTATRTGYRVGDIITVLDRRQARQRLQLVGIVSFGSSKQYADQAVVVLTRADMVTLTGATGYRQIVVAATSGVSQQALAQRVALAVPGAAVTTGARYRYELANDATREVDPVLTGLLIFALVACVVGAFVIYNTFNILLAQRVRELALLRCVGATRSQVFGSVVAEAAVVGAIGAAAGVGIGIGVGYALFAGLSAFGTSFPAHPLVLTYPPVMAALLLGIGITVCSAVIPAARIMRVPPLAALRAVPGPRVAGARGKAVLIALALACATIGTAMTAVGSHQSDPRRAALIVVAGGVVNFLAVLLLAPLLAGPLIAALGWLPGRLLGAPARLARGNARRNPGRTASTTAALMVGVGLMSAASVAVTTVQVTSDVQINQHYPVDYVLQPQWSGSAGTVIPPAVADALRSSPAIGAVLQVRLLKAKVAGTQAVVGTADPDGFARLAKPDLNAGSYANFRPGTVILFAGSAAGRGHQVGDRVQVVTAPGREATFTVAALAAGQSQIGDAVVTWSDFAELGAGRAGDDMVMVKAAAGVSPAASRVAVEAVTNHYPLVTVRSIAEWRAQITASVNGFIALIAALLAITVLIALIGIMNTLSLSVVERTRESALIRALGFTRGQLRASLLVEASLMGVLGGLVGIGFGVLYGWATTRVMFTGFAAVTTIPYGGLAGYLAATAVAAVAAGVLPAHRAARTSIVAAMAET